MIFVGISKDFDLTHEAQYDTIGQFWDDLAAVYGLENLRGLGYAWKNNKISYAIGLKRGNIQDYNLRIELPDDGWVLVTGQTDQLKEIYDEIYKGGPLQYEIETFQENGSCRILFHRTP